MPELPEVETIRRILSPQLRKRTVVSVCINNPDVIAYPDEKTFSEMLCNQTIEKLDRRGKYLIMCLESGDRLCLHLRMTGQLLVMDKSRPVEKHTHLVLDLSDGIQLRYIDVRRFGRFWLFKKDESDELSGMSLLGIEPTDKALCADYIMKRSQNSRKPVKEMLLDQTLVCGIGNIYADEILFEAKIHPQSKCCDLSYDDFSRLAKAISKIIAWGIEANKMTAEEYLDGKGREYRNIPYLKMYGRSGQACKVCGTLIEKVTVSSRSSCFCPDCQRKANPSSVPS